MTDMILQFLRLIWLYHIVLRDQSPTRESLARQWDVDVRTVYRYYSAVKLLSGLLDKKDFGLNDKQMARIARKIKRPAKKPPTSTKRKRSRRVQQNS